MKSLKWHSITILVLVFALVVSLATNVAIFMQRQLYFTLYKQTILDPMGMDDYLPRDKPEVPNGKELVVFLGDSRALAWPAPESDHFVFANRGAGGQTSTQVLGRFSNDIPALQPDIIVIQVGINDLTAIPTLPNQQRRIIARCKENIQALTEQAIAVDATVILTTIFPVRRTVFPWQTFGSESVANGVEDVNKFIRSLAGTNVIVMDTSEILASSDGNLQPEYSLDTLHLNEKGYLVLNIALSSILEKIPDRKP